MINTFFLESGLLGGSPFFCSLSLFGLVLELLFIYKFLPRMLFLGKFYGVRYCDDSLHADYED